MSKEPFKTTANDALNFEERLGPLIFEPAAEELLSRIINLPASAILEIACGTGRVTKHLKENFPGASVIATDINPVMMELAQKQLTGISFQVADAQQLPFAYNSFDLVVNQFGLMFLPEKQTGVNEALRVLQPGGHFVFTTWDSTASMPLFKLIIDDIFAPVLKHVDTSRFYSPFSLHNPDELNDYLKQAGFSEYKVSLMQFKGKAHSPAQIIDSYFLNHPWGKQVKESYPDSYENTIKTMEQGLIQQFGAGAFEFELRALLGIGKK